MIKTCVVIPIYKETLNNYEIVSLCRLYHILGKKYDIFFVTYKELNLSKYIEISNKYGYDYIRYAFFDKNYFNNGSKNYNILVSSYEFYDTFSEYDYMLIYHLDCYIFSDKIDYWTNIGIPLIECVYQGYLYDSTIVKSLNGEGLRNIEYFKNFIKSNNELIYTFHNTINNNSCSDYRYCAEDVFFTNFLSKLKDSDFDLYYEFGISNYFYDNVNKLGKLPMMIHSFRENNENEFDKLFIYNYIGNPNDCVDNCINLFIII